VQNLGLAFLSAFLFFAYSRVLDFTLANLHLPLLTSLAALVFAVLSGGPRRAFSSPSGIALAAFTLWVMIGIPFSFWRGGSFEVFKEVWMKSFLSFVLVVGLVRTVRQSQRLMNVIALAIFVIAVLCAVLGRSDSGRLALPGGVLGNPNDLAQILLVGLPFWGLVAVRKGLPVKRAAAATIALIVVYFLFRTGSRAALIALVVFFVTLLLSASLVNRLKLAAASLVAILLLVVATPEPLRQRYQTLFRVEDEIYEVGSMTEQASTSAEYRLRLLLLSLELTARNPVFGVGLGNFQPASAPLASARFGRATWRESHNSYTQVSSEGGVPGILFFGFALLYCLRETYRLARECRLYPHLLETSYMGMALFASLLMFAITMLFSSIAYSPYYATLVGLGAAFALAAREELEWARRSAPAPAPVARAAAPVNSVRPDKRPLPI